MIDAVDLGFKYNSKKFIFRRHSFNVGEGSILAILGPNGRGKTTLLKTMIGLLPLNEGHVRINGHVGYVPQHAAAVFPYSVLDMVVMGRARHIPMFSSPKKADYDAAREALKELDLIHFMDRSFLELSGGEKQMVLIARALVSECRVLILDEPASALDFKNQDLVLRTLRRLGRERNITIVFTTHYPQHAVHIADLALLMYDSLDYRFGKTAEIMTDDQLKRLYGMEIRNITLDHRRGVVKTIVPVFA